MASGFNHPSGGKTDTTNDYTDAWYFDFTKRLTMGIWVGADDHKGICPGHTGADDAVPVWISVMTHAEKGKRPFLSLGREEWWKPLFARLRGFWRDLFAS